MTKAQREKEEKLRIKQLLNDNPKLKELLWKESSNDSKNLTEIISDAIYPYLQQQFILGINAGFISACSIIKSKKTFEEIIEYCEKEENRIKKEMKIK